MSGLTIIIIAAAFFALSSIVLSGKKARDLEGYILARNSLGGGTMSMTLFATGMGVWILFGPAESLLTAGLAALVGYALASTLSLWMFWRLGERIRNILPQGKSLTEFVLERFGTAMYLLVLAVSFLYMAIAMAAGLSGIGLAGQIVFGIPLWQTIAILGFATLSYTALGGFRASVIAGKIQTFVILPLFALVVVMSAVTVGDFGAAWNAANVPAFGWSGIEYGIALIIGVLAAEAFNQVWWQHVYSGKDARAMKRGFFISGLMVFPVVMLAGLIGVYAAAAGSAGNPSVAVFDFLATLPQWLSASGMVLAVALVMGNMDSLLNGMVSVCAVDIKRVKPGISDASLLRIAKLLTLLFALGAMIIATHGFSVLYLFLIADLICAGAAFPVFYGMFSKSVEKRTAFIACIIGIVSGFILFPDPSFTHGNLLQSFLVAFLVPALIVLVFRKRGAETVS